MIVTSAMKLGTALLQLLKKMSFKDIILVVLVLTTVSFAWASNSNKSDAIESKAALENYKTEIEAKKYDDKINSLSLDKADLTVKLEKKNKQRIWHQGEASKWKKKFEAIKDIKPDIVKITKEVDKLDGVKKVCDELNKYDVGCFIYSSE